MEAKYTSAHVMVTVYEVHARPVVVKKEPPPPQPSCCMVCHIPEDVPESRIGSSFADMSETRLRGAGVDAGMTYSSVADVSIVSCPPQWRHIRQRLIHCFGSITNTVSPLAVPLTDQSTKGL